MVFHSAIVLTPCRDMIYGLTNSDLGKSNYAIALEQHKCYIKALESCDLTVYEMQANENYPDSCFVEDTAVVDEKFAILCNMSEPSRSGEIDSVKTKLLDFYSQESVFEISAPGFLDGGDIMRVENRYFIGLSNRTNLVGAKQFEEISSQFGFDTEFVKFDHCLHLKSEVNYLGDGILLLSKEFQKNAQFHQYEQIRVKAAEIYAANSLRINDKILIPKGFPDTKRKLTNCGFDIVELAMSEFQKLDGGLSCLSLRI